MNGKRSLMRVKKLIVKFLTRCMNPLQQVVPISISNEEEEVEEPALVLEGHFVVLSSKVEVEAEEEKQRFVIELRHLRNPALLKLLKEAEEEYGFHQGGALVVPCTPQQLEKILQGNYI